MELVKEIEMTGPDGTKTKSLVLSRTFTQFLEPVNERFPVGFFRDLQKLFIEGLPKNKFDSFRNLAVDYFNKVVSEKVTTEKKDILWMETVIFLSLHCLSQHFDEPVFWPENFKSLRAEDKAKPVRLLCHRILNVYEMWGESNLSYPCARPYTFYLLMEAVSNSDSLSKLIHNSGNEYFKLKEYLSIIAGTQDAVISNDNELTAFAQKYKENESILSSVTPFSRDLAIANYSSILKNINSGIDISQTVLSNKKQVTALVVGLPRSGKTTMIKTLFETANKGEISLDNPLKTLFVNQLPKDKDNEIALYMTPGRPKPNSSDCWELEGDIHIADSLYKLILTDTRGGAISEAPKQLEPEEELPVLEETLTKTDLLLILLDPITFMRPTIDLYNGIGGRIKYLLQNSKHAMVSIVLSKFDEYGVVLTGPRSLINTPLKLQKLSRFQNNTSETTWNEFNDEILNGFNDNTRLRETLTPLLKKLKPLFSTFCITHKHLPVNLYIVNSIDAKDQITFQRTGIPFIFQDFEAYMDCVIKKFPAKHVEVLSDPVKNVVLTVNQVNGKTNGIMVSWESISDSQYQIKKRRGSSNGSWNQWEENYATNISTNSFVDVCTIASGQTYQYGVTAINPRDNSKSELAVSNIYFIPPKKIDWLPIIIIIVLLIIFFVIYIVFSQPMSQ
ncbi:MAG: hypothetical protein QM737_01185 [Ferruginibacter sp.]